MKMSRRGKRILIAVPVVLAIAFILYLAGGVATYICLSKSYASLKPGMTQAEVRSHLRLLTESEARPGPCVAEWAKEHPYAKLERYDLLGPRNEEGDIVVAYDKAGRVVWTIDIYE